jgi:hypothetical protein
MQLETIASIGREDFTLKAYLNSRDGGNFITPKGILSQSQSMRRIAVKSYDRFEIRELLNPITYAVIDMRYLLSSQTEDKRPIKTICGRSLMKNQTSSHSKILRPRDDLADLTILHDRFLPNISSLMNKTVQDSEGSIY